MPFNSQGGGGGSAGAFTSSQQQHTNGHFVGNGAKGKSSFCMTKGCVKTAADILDNMDQTVDPCQV